MFILTILAILFEVPKVKPRAKIIIILLGFVHYGSAQRFLKEYPKVRDPYIVGKSSFCLDDTCYGPAVALGSKPLIPWFPESPVFIPSTMANVRLNSYNFFGIPPDNTHFLPSCSEYTAKAARTKQLVVYQDAIKQCLGPGWGYNTPSGDPNTAAGFCSWRGGAMSVGGSGVDLQGPISICQEGQPTKWNSFNNDLTTYGDNIWEFKDSKGASAHATKWGYAPKTFEGTEYKSMLHMPAPLVNCPTGMTSDFKTWLTHTSNCVNFVHTTRYNANLCFPPGFIRCTQTMCTKADPWTSLIEQSGQFMCAPTYLLNAYQRAEGTPDTCYSHHGAFYARGNYDLPGCIHYPGVTKCITKPQCHQYVPALKYHSPNCTYPSFIGDMLCVEGPSEYNNGFCEAGVGYTQITVVCSKHVTVQLCCSQCVTHEPTNHAVFTIPLTDYGSHCSIKWDGDNSVTFTLNAAYYQNSQYSFLWHVFALPWWIICSIVVSIVWLLHFLLIRLRVLRLILFIWLWLNKTLWWFLTTKPPEMPIDGVCPYRYRKRNCKARVTPETWPIHYLVFHGHFWHMFNPRYMWTRFTATNLPLPAKDKVYIKTPIGPLSGNSWSFWLLVLLCFGHVRKVESIQFDWTGSTMTTTLKDVTFAFSKQTTYYTCTTMGQYWSDPGYKCDCYLKCSSNDACTFLPSNVCKPNSQWVVTNSFFWREGCFLLGQGSACCKCYLTTTANTKIVTRQKCVHKTTSFSLTVTCPNGKNEVKVTGTGNYNTTCGQLAIHVPQESELENLHYDSMDSKYYQTTGAILHDSDDCSPAVTSCSHNVIPGGSIISNCYPNNHKPYEPHDLNSCAPFKKGNILGLRSCTTKVYTITFEPIVFTASNTMLQDVKISSCYKTTPYTCVCHLYLLCQDVVYINQHYYPCNTDIVQEGTCKNTEACVTFSDTEYCGKLDGYHPASVDHNRPQYGTEHSKTCFLCNWDFFNWQHIVLIFILIIALIIILNILVFTIKKCIAMNKKDK